MFAIIAIVFIVVAIIDVVVITTTTTTTTIIMTTAATCVQRLWPSLNYGFSQVLGSRYDTATAEAWRRVYSYISLQMKRGMENPDIEPCEDGMGS